MKKQISYLLVATLFPLIGQQAFGGRIPTQAVLEKQLKSRKSPSFSEILTRWQNDFGSKAVDPLLKLAKNKRKSDSDRYIAIMGVARLGGKDAAPLLLPL